MSETPALLRRPGASSVIVHDVPEELAERFAAWHAGISAAALGSPGYLGTDVYPPAPARPRQWVVVLHFTDRDAEAAWLESPVRNEWVRRLEADLGAVRRRRLEDGFGPWFAQLAGGHHAVPASWQMALTVLLVLYPTTFLLNSFVTGHVRDHFGSAAAILAGNALGVALMQWALLPAVRPLLGPWYDAARAGRSAAAAAGAAGIVLVLLALAAAFTALAGR